MEHLLRVGVISSTHGVRGEVKVYPTTDDVNRFKKLKKVVLDTGREYIDLEISGVKFFKNLVILKFKGIDNINDIEKYKGCTLKVAEENLSDLEDGEFYYHEIIGLDVYENDVLIGQVKEILQPGANDVWVVKRKGKRDLLLPYIPPVVLNVDVAGNRVDVDVLEGLDDED